VDGAGNVYVADFYNQSVKVIVAVGGSIPANPAILTLANNLLSPTGVAVDASGNVYVTEAVPGVVKQIKAVGGSVPTSNPTILTLASGFSYPADVAVDAAGDVYVAAFNSPVKEIVAVGGTIPSNPTVLSLGSTIFQAYGVALDGAGNVYVADSTRTSAVEIPLATPPSVTFVDTNVGSASSSNPQTVTVGNNGYDPTSTNPLTFSGVSTATANFALDATNACSTSTSLEPGQTCVLAADFMPQASGTPLTDAITLADNNLNNISSTSSPQFVPLSGNGLQQTPGVVVAPATVTYGTATVALTAAISFTGTVAPTGTVKFTIDSGLPVVASCSATTSPLFCTANYPSNTLQVVATHTITASIAATPGFLMASGTNTLTVSQATLTVGIIGNPTKAYDGTTTASLASANYQVGNLVGSDSITVTQPIGTYAAATAGPEGVTAALTSANYTATTGYLSNYVLPTTATGPGIITQATSVTTVICSPTSVTYNGAAQTPCTASVMGAGSLNQSLILTYSSNVNAGVNTASATATYSGDNNHAGSTGSATFTILPAPVTAQAGVGNAVYDGNTHSPSACAVTGAYTGNLTCTNSPASVGPDVINTTIIPVVSGSNLSNFAIMKVNGNFTINQSPSVTTVICSPSSVPYTGAPQTPCTATVTGVNLNQSVTVSYSSNVSAGVNTASATATYAGDTDHSGSTGSKTFTITQATPVVSWPNPPSIVYGTGTGPAQKNATATGVGGVSLSGSYFYTTSDGTIFTVGTHPLGVAFTPTDTTDYVPVSAYAYLTVTKATPVVTWTPPAAITYGTALSATQLNTNSSVPGSYSYSPIAGTVLHAGGQTLSVTFTPNDTTDYNPVTTTVPLTVNKATPVITWQTPASITYGTPISATQLDATANVPGTFLYTASTGPNPLGVLLPPGTTALSATLTPTDATDYNSVTAYVVFTVSKAQTTTTLAVTTTQTVTGTTATLTATVKPQIGGTPTGTVTYYNGSAILGSAAVGTPFTTGVLPVGTDQITAVYGGDTNFVGSSSSASAVVSIAPTTVQLIEPLGTVFYPASAVGFTVIVPLKNLQLISGTITLYDGSTVIGTYSLPIGGILAGITPPLSRGTHSLRAVYGGNAQYPPGQSPIITVTVQ
jgi:hypothetical protein